MSKLQGLMWPEGLGKLKKCLHLIWFRTRDLTACSSVPVIQCTKSWSLCLNAIFPSKRNIQISKRSYVSIGWFLRFVHLGAQVLVTKQRQDGRLGARKQAEFALCGTADSVTIIPYIMETRPLVEELLDGDTQQAWKRLAFYDFVRYFLDNKHGNMIV
jgi:hypothetical protein